MASLVSYFHAADKVFGPGRQSQVCLPYRQIGPILSKNPKKLQIREFHFPHQHNDIILEPWGGKQTNKKTSKLPYII